MSTRDQRVGTSHPDIVKEDVSLEYITMSNTGEQPPKRRVGRVVAIERRMRV